MRSLSMISMSLALVGGVTLAGCKKKAEDKPTEAAKPAAPAAPAPTPPPAAPTPTPPAPAATKGILDVAAEAGTFKTLAAAVEAAGLVETLRGPGPFTVFAPTDDAFAKLPAGTVDGLLKPEKKADLAGLLTYHVVAGSVDAAALAQQIEAGGGSATLTTVQGATLTAKSDGMGGITLTDGKGGTAKVTTADVRQSNGVVHVIDSVLMPK